MGVEPKIMGKKKQIIHLFIGFSMKLSPSILGFFLLFLDTSISELQLCGYVSEILLMVQKSQTTTWDGDKTPYKQWDELPTSTGDRRISEPSTVCLSFQIEN